MGQHENRPLPKTTDATVVERALLPISRINTVFGGINRILPMCHAGFTCLAIASVPSIFGYFSSFQKFS
jgi:hypothetical protein